LSDDELEKLHREFQELRKRKAAGDDVPERR
jgi:hypothetical protein